MARKPQYRKDDATGSLSPDEPTQETPTGLKIGLPKRKDVLDVFRKVAGSARPSKER